MELADRPGRVHAGLVLRDRRAGLGSLPARDPLPRSELPRRIARGRQELLAASGAASIDLTIYATRTRSSSDVQILQANVAEAGINVAIEVVDEARYTTRSTSHVLMGAPVIST